MNPEIKLKATGLVAALMISIIDLVLIALFGSSPLAAEIASALKWLAGVLAGGLVIDLGFVKKRSE